ncbi:MULTISPECIES: hypothetical protein [Candidatus Ichthyocystis]|uniref:Putative DNA polymerase III subunit delta n=1 Tax=Candidatus Ichthyocystis hellenicum TaxID=1561003 RepID=A0A0S4M1Z7_9BURK|nr:MULTISPECIES: hypothetical protein [Ichthyocystis]CUT17649.1 putative DNA polymerase III subunit delta [Candidatus Ichthyocystis hellenicum]
MLEDGYWYDLCNEQCSDPYFLFPWHVTEYKSLMKSLRLKPVQVVLLSGLTLTGLFKLAHLVSIGLLCEKDDCSVYPCGCCVGCRWASADSHPDFRCLLSSSHLLEFLPSFVVSSYAEDKSKSMGGISVDRVRELTHFFSLSTYRGRRVVFIAPVESLTDNALQALLKTLEEPVSETTFVLMSYSPHRLKATLLSRCQIHWRVPSPRPDAIEKWLSNLSIPTSVSALLSSSAEFIVYHRPFYALLLMITETGNLIMEVRDNLFRRPLDFWVVTSSCRVIMQKWGKFLTSHQAVSVLLDILVVMVHKHLGVYWGSDAEKLSLQQKKCGLLAWLRFIDCIQEARSLIHTALNQELILDHIMVYHPLR